MASSPELPSMDELLVQKKPRVVVSGSRAATIPEDAARGFSKASDLLRCQYPTANVNDLAVFDFVPDGTEQGRPPKPAKEPKKRAIQKQVDDEPDVNSDEATASFTQTTKAVGRRSRGSKTESRSKHFESRDADAGQSKRAKKRAQNGEQTKIRKGKIKKAMGCTSDSVVDKTIPAAEGLKALAAGPENEQSCQNVLKEIDLPLGLEKATARRLDWTPVKDKENIEEPTSPSPVAEAPLEASPQKASANAAVNTFDSLATKFAFDGASQVKPKVHSRSTEDDFTKKRRKLDLVDTIPLQRPASSSKSPHRRPAIKKKPQTITEKATKQFRQIDDQLPAETTTLLSYFSQSQERQPRGIHPDRGDQTGNKKGKKNQLKSKGMSMSLLSPSKAMKAIDNQELLFGTSSQLLREDSPTLLRDLQAAVRISEEELAALQVPEDQDSKLQLSYLRQARSALWPAAARDSQGSLLEAEVVDLTSDSPPTGNSVKFKPTSPLFNFASATEVNDNGQSLPVLYSGPGPPGHALGVATEEDSMNSKRMQVQDDCASMPTIEQAAQCGLGNEMIKTLVDKPNNSSCPDFGKLPVEKLRSQIAAYGFKPVRSKKNMIALLEKCWHSTNKQTPSMTVPTGTISRDQYTSHKESSSPVKRRGRPPKEKAASDVINTILEEPAAARKRGRPRKSPSVVISDRTKQPPHTQLPSHPERSEDIVDDTPSMPSPPRRTQSSLSQPLELATPATEVSSVPKSTVSADKSDPSFIFSKIGEAIRSFPPTHEPKNLTWNEKILLYDPVVLEDLTVWLNTVGLGRVGIDDEVWPTLVRDWCESKSICCLWKMNLRGGERARY